MEFYVEDDTEDNSALAVASQITFRGLVAYEPVAYKKKVYFKKICDTSQSFSCRFKEPLCQ